MSLSLQVAVKDGSFLRGDVVAIRPDGFEYCEGDCLSKWIKAGRSEGSWHCKFLIIYCDGALEEDLSHLIEPYSQEDSGDSTYRRLRYLNIEEYLKQGYEVNLGTQDILKIIEER